MINEKKDPMIVIPLIYSNSINIQLFFKGVSTENCLRNLFKLIKIGSKILTPIIAVFIIDLFFDFVSCLLLYHRAGLLEDPEGIGFHFKIFLLHHSLVFSIFSLFLVHTVHIHVKVFPHLSQIKRLRLLIIIFYVFRHLISQALHVFFFIILQIFLLDQYIFIFGEVFLWLFYSFSVILASLFSVSHGDSQTVRIKTLFIVMDGR